MNIHNISASVAPIIPANQRRTPFMRLRLEKDALPRLTDMSLSVFIVRRFFYASIDYRSFACSLTLPRAEAKKGCSPFGLKIRAGGLEIFQPKGKRIALLRTFLNPSKQRFLS
jgi:hypothetical protein